MKTTTKTYSDMAIVTKRNGINKKQHSIFPNKDGVYPTNDNFYIVRIWKGNFKNYTTIAKIKDKNEAEARLLKEINLRDKEIKENLINRKSNNDEKILINFHSGFSIREK